MPDGAFGKCKFLNDVPIEELQSVLRTHKEFVKERFGSGDGKEAFVDAGDLGAEPEAYAEGDASDGEETAESLKRTNGSGAKKAAVTNQGAVSGKDGKLTSGVSLLPSYFERVGNELMVIVGCSN